MIEALRTAFAAPPPAYRGAPFWSWNDRLHPAELARQVRDMKAHGMGGFFMHSREGLETPYMGAEWMECVRETVRVAAEEGMAAWLYDEDRWPSGAAGGIVPAIGGDRFRAKLLTVEERDDLPADDNGVLAVFAVTLDAGRLVSLRRLRPGEGPTAGETCLVFRREISRPREWFNDDSPADNLNPDAVAAFIASTYEAYRREVGAEFGKAVPGIFTDEPNVFDPSGVPPDRRGLPWTDALPDFFRLRRGYDLLDVVPWLFYDGAASLAGWGEQAARARHDYWWTISERFTAAFSQQIGEWCERHGLAFTGHYLYENELGDAIIRGGAVMPHYRWQHVPGIDMLREQVDEQLTVKQCSSVANQFGCRRVLSETYGCTGWEFTFEGQKWVGDWQYVLGVNLRCQHLALYTLRGCRKRDYPPAFNYNTTWWKYNAVVEDYFARLGCVLAEGRAVRDVLLLHPIATGWAMLREGEASKQAVNAWGERLNAFVRALLATHYDFDFGDEQVMAAAAVVEGGALRVGEAHYRLVIIPPETQTLLGSTVELLERFLAAGGQVIAFAPPPAAIEAVPDDRLARLWQHPGVTLLSGVAGLAPALEGSLPRRISLLDPYGQQAAELMVMQRRFDGGQAFFIVNTARARGVSAEVTLEGSGRLEEWDALTGAIRSVPARVVDGALSFRAEFSPAGSRLYVVCQDGAPEAPAVEGRPTPAQEVAFIGPVCPFTRSDPNVLTLDMCQYRLADAAWSGTMEVWQAQQAVRAALGMRPVYYNGLPQRYRWALKPHPADGAAVSLRFVFTVRDIPAAPVYLLVEGARQFAIFLNDEPVPNAVEGWYLDRAFDKVRLPALRPGRNELILTCSYTNAMELEDCYLLGDFAVSPDRALVAEPLALRFGDWTTQGYLHYAGSMIYHAVFAHRPGGPVRLWLGEYRAMDVAVYVNGRPAGHIPWAQANGLDITPYLTAGPNAVDIEVVSSPRNMLGPLHQAAGHLPWTDWRSFRRTGPAWTPEYVVQPWGLIGQVRITQG